MQNWELENPLNSNLRDAPVQLLLRAYFKPLMQMVLVSDDGSMVAWSSGRDLKVSGAYGYWCQNCETSHGLGGLDQYIGVASGKHASYNSFFCGCVE